MYRICSIYDFVNKELAEKFIIPLYTGDESIALVGSDDHNSGIIHAGIYNLKENVKVGHIYTVCREQLCSLSIAYGS